MDKSDWKHKIADHLKKVGYHVSVEETVNGYTDIIARKGPATYVVEIETGKSDWRANIDKNIAKDHHEIVIATTNQTAQNQITAALEKGKYRAHIRVIRALEIVGTNQDPLTPA